MRHEPCHPPVHPVGPRHAEALTRRRAEIRAQLDSIEARLVALRSERQGMNDDDEHDPDGDPLSAQWSLLEGRREQKQDLLAQIDAAIAEAGDAAHSSGDPVLCTRCSRPIPPARLAVRPEARTCVDCAD